MADANAQSAQNGTAVDKRTSTDQSNGVSDAQPSALGKGVRGAGPGEEAKGLGEEQVGRHKELDGEQMAAPGEGDVYEAVAGKGGKSGASGSMQGMESDLDRKKAEQAPYREKIKEQREQDIDVGGVLGQRGGPANPVEKNNYPNTSD